MCPKLRTLVVTALILGFLFPPLAAAASSATVVTLWIGNPVMSIGTTRRPIDTEGTTPVIVENRTLVPIRAVIEAFGGVVEWDSATRRVMVVLGSNTLDLWIGKSTASLNGTDLPIDAANPRVVAVVMSGRTMLPLRFVSESLGITVTWESSARMITLTCAGEPVPEVPAAPVLVAPADGSQFVNVLPSLVWQKEEEADVSWLRILSSSGAEVYARSSLSTDTYHVPSGLLTDGTYTWQVSLHNKGGWGAWSTPRGFSISTVAAPAAPVLMSPADQAEADLSSLSFTWNPVADADRYRIRVLRSGETVFAEDGLHEPSYLVPSDMPLLGSGTYTWQVAAHGVGGWGAWSTASSFLVPRPDNGAVLKRLPAFQGGKGKLTIKLGTGKDAVVKLVKQGNTQASIAVYVRADSTTTVTGIPDGIYRILFARGDAYNAPHGVFALNASAAEFKESITYTTTSTTYSGWTITLNATAGDNAPTTPLPGDSFGGY